MFDFFAVLMVFLLGFLLGIVVGIIVGHFMGSAGRRRIPSDDDDIIEDKEIDEEE